MKNENEVKRYLFEYNLFTINILSVFIMLIIIFFHVFIVDMLDKNFIETIGLPILDNAANSDFFSKQFAFIVISFIVMLGWFILHELIHAIAYRIAGAKRENISFGVVLEKGIFYCKCNNYVDKKCILISVLAPFVVIGIFTYIFGVIFYLGWLVYLSLINIMGCAGDLAMFSFFVFKDKDIKFKELDDSTTFCLETKEDLTNKKFLFVKLKEVLDKDIESDTKNKLINITKTSYIIFCICFILLIFSLFMLF